MEKRVAAYGYFFFAGITSACLGIAAFGGARFIVELFRNPAAGLSPEILMAGVAAVIGAGAMHKPFLRAVQARRRPLAYGFVTLGVIAAHVAYALLFLLFEMAGDGMVPTLTQLEGAMYVGAFAVMFGFLPNMAFGSCFAEFLLERNRRAGAGETGASGAEVQRA